jgi:hypothetical protein
MVIPKRVGVAPGTTTLQLGAPPSKGESCLYYGSVNTMGSGWPAAAMATAAGMPSTAAATAAVARGGAQNPYASEAELKGLRGGGLGYIITPTGYTPGKVPWEVVGLYTDANGRRGCDPQHYERGEAGFYFDTPLGGLGRGMPTDAQMSIQNGWTPTFGPGYMPVDHQMVPTADGRLLPLPWVPPDGWNPAGNSGPAWAWGRKPSQLGEITEDEVRANADRQYKLLLYGTIGSLALGLGTFLVSMRGKKERK